MSHHKHTDQILGFTFGQILAENDCILVDLYVRTMHGQSEVEGKRGGLVVHRSILEDLLAARDSIFTAMAEVGADQDILPPAGLTIPAWDHGPTAQSAAGRLALCHAFGVTEVVPESGAVAAVMEVADLVPAARAHTGEYLIPHQVLKALMEAIPKVLVKFGQATPGAAAVH